MLKASSIRLARGFTILELMIALGITAILVAIAAPTMRSFIENARIRASSESLQNGLSIARNEAVRRNARVEFVAVDTGWVVQLAGTADPLQSASGREGTDGLTLTLAPGDADRITYDAFGRPTANIDGSARLTQVDVASANPPSSSSYRPLRIQIQATGTARLCNPAVGTDNPARCL